MIKIYTDVLISYLLSAYFHVLDLKTIEIWFPMNKTIKFWVVEISLSLYCIQNLFNCKNFNIKYCLFI